MVNIPGISSQNQVFAAIKKFIENYTDQGYLSFGDQDNDSIDITIGVEKFIIKSEIILSSDRIFFKVYHWVFNLSKVNKYKLEEAPELDFCKSDGNMIYFIVPKGKEGQRKYNELGYLDQGSMEIKTRQLLVEFENFIDKQQSALNEKIEKASNLL